MFETFPIDNSEVTKTKEIPRDEWPYFFDQFNRDHEGWVMTTEILGSQIGAQVQGRELPFEGIFDEWNELQGTQIVIMAGQKPDDHISHRIGRPVTVSMEETTNGLDKALAIKCADGVVTLLRFRCSSWPRIAEGLADQPGLSLPNF